VPLEEHHDGGSYIYPILRKSQVWKRLTLEEALEFGKARTKVTFKYTPLGPNVTAGTKFSDTVDYIDLNPTTRSNVRLGYYGWSSVNDLEYLEE
jgi:hypothetical protein